MKTKTKSTMEKAISRNGNLRQFRNQKFGVILSAAKVRRIEKDETYPGGYQAWVEKQMEKAFKESFSGFLDVIEEEARACGDKRLMERIEKRRNVIEDNKRWRTRNQKKPVNDRGELKSFSALADMFDFNKKGKR